jgi:hypothetical protein
MTGVRRRKHAVLVSSFKDISLTQTCAARCAVDLEQGVMPLDLLKGGNGVMTEFHNRASFGLQKRLKK